MQSESAGTLIGGEMAESKQRAEEFEINPDGADLDGTAEIERQQIERQQSGRETGSAASQPTTAPVADQREKREREARAKVR